MNPEHYHSAESEHEQGPYPARASRRPAEPGSRPAADRDHEPRLDDELTPAEHEEKEKAREQATAALRTVYGILQNQPTPKTPEVRAAIDATALQELKPAYKSSLEHAIVSDNLSDRGEQEFVERGLEVLALWIHLQGLKRGTDRDLANLRSGMQGM